MTYRDVRQGRTAKRKEAISRINKGGHTMVLDVQGDRTIPEVAVTAARAMCWWEDLRRGRLSPYGALFRFIDTAVALGTPRSALEQIPRVVDWYIADSFDPTTTAEIKLIA